MLLISAEESGNGHRHLFAFKPAGDADDCNYNVGILCGCDGLR